MTRILLRLVLVVVMVAGGAPAAVAQAPSGEEIMRRAHLAMYYPGEDMRARVTMRLVSKDGGERVREMTMSRRDIKEGGEQRYFIFFHRPPDVRDMAFLVWKYPGRDDDRWLYVPALKLVRRIAASDKHTSFVGSDFSRKLSWIDRATWLPLKEEYYDRRGELARVFTADELKEIQGFWTVTRRVMKNVQTGHRTEVAWDDVRYNLKLAPDLFSERALRAPPAELIR